MKSFMDFCLSCTFSRQFELKCLVAHARIEFEGQREIMAVLQQDDFVL